MSKSLIVRTKSVKAQSILFKAIVTARQVSHDVCKATKQVVDTTTSTIKAASIHPINK